MQNPLVSATSQENFPLVLHPLLGGITLTGVLQQDVAAFLAHHGCPKTAEHSAQVAAEARRVAEYVGVDPLQAVLPEEKQFPMIIHQKLSKVLASHIFGVTDEQVLSAVECHTTLKAHATVLDKVIFVADKIAWDQDGIPPYRDELLAALEQSLDHAALVYVRYLWERRHTLRVVHPWMREAYIQLSQELFIEERD